MWSWRKRGDEERRKLGGHPNTYTKTEGFLVTSGCNVAQKRKRTYRNRQSLHVVGNGGMKKKLAHGEGRTRSLQIARVS